MKTNPATFQQHPSPQAQNLSKTNKRPENKDDLDSRKHEEQHRKGDDVTHNKKGERNEPKKRK